MIYDNEKLDEAKIVGNYKPEHLYTAHFKNGEGKFFNIVTEENGDTTVEYNQPIPTRNRVKLTLTFIKKNSRIDKVSFRKFKEYKNKGLGGARMGAKRTRLIFLLLFSKTRRLFATSVGA